MYVFSEATHFFCISIAFIEEFFFVGGSEMRLANVANCFSKLIFDRNRELRK